MDKVRLPKEVAEAIEHHLPGMGSQGIFDFVAGWHKHDVATVELAVIKDFYEENPFKLAVALSVGYEVEQTPEDKVREYYNEQRGLIMNSQEPAHTAVKRTLDFLNIKIEGVNA